MEKTHKPASPVSTWLILSICIFLALIIGIVFGQTRHFGFLFVDDGTYVYNNPMVTQGLTWPGFVSAFDYKTSDNWVPLTTLSHMLDWQLFEADPAGHHLMNVLFHALTAILLFLVLNEMTSRLWPSALAATVFAIHPLRAESVAWVSERKDVLCGVFFMLTLWTYARYARNDKSWRLYVTTLLFSALALMAKPMVVTLPIVLLLLDYWPLNRFEKNILPRLIIEKIPIALLSMATCVLTVLSQQAPIQGMEKIPFGLRVENTAVSYVAYLWQSICPSRLLFLYPYPLSGFPVWEVSAAILFLAAASLAAFYWRTKYPYLWVGWLWYIVMLVPVIGLVQVGAQARADRYMYLPEIGLGVMMIWFIADISRGWPERLALLGGPIVVGVAILMNSAMNQVSYWQSDESVLNHTLALSPSNYWASVTLGIYHMHQGRLDDAISELNQAIADNPDNAIAYSTMGDTMLRAGRVDDAIVQYHKALKINPNDILDHSDLGYALVQKRQYDDAIAECGKALNLDSHNADANFNLGLAFHGKGQNDEAITHYQEAVRLQPGYVMAHYNLAMLLAAHSHLDEAAQQFQTVIQLNPDYTNAYGNLANVLMGQGKLDEAIAQYQNTVELAPGSAQAHFRFGQALEKKGRTSDAIAQFRLTLQLNPNHQDAKTQLRNLGALPQ